MKIKQTNKQTGIFLTKSLYRFLCFVHSALVTQYEKAMQQMMGKFMLSTHMSCQPTVFPRTNTTVKEIYTWCYGKPHLIMLPPCKAFKSHLCILISWCNFKNSFRLNKENFTDAGFEPVTPGLTCLCRHVILEVAGSNQTLFVQPKVVLK